MQLQSPIFFTKIPKIQTEGKTIFNNDIEKNWMPTCRRMDLNFYVSLYTKKNSKWIKSVESQGSPE